MSIGLHLRRGLLLGALALAAAAPPLAAQPAETSYSIDNQLDLNNAEFEEILRLPIGRDVAEAIYERIQYGGPLDDLFELREVDGVSQEVLLALKPLVYISPFSEKSERESRLENLYYDLDNWSGQEGTNQALVDSWIEQALDPIDINRVRYDQLVNLSGVSPVDAAAIVNYREEVGSISSLRDLRGAPFLSYFGYRNARDFVSFDGGARQTGFHGNLLFRSSNTPFFEDEEDVALSGETADIAEETTGQSNQYPDVYTRFIGSYGPDIKMGFSYWRSLNEPTITAEAGPVAIPKGKWYLGIENKTLGPVAMRKFYVGNYALAFGQGVTFENTDFFTPRKSGFGFRKRFIGLSGDNSRTRQFQLTGAATELAWKDAHLFLFGAFDARDAVLNKEAVIVDGERVRPFNQFIVLDQRFEFAPGDTVRSNEGLSWRESVKELTYGLHAAYDVLPTTQVGLTWYESAYDRPLRPDFTEIVLDAETDQIALPDNEILNAYGGPVSDGSNPFWDAAKSFRRVYGIDVQSVFNNVSVQAEYAELDTDEGSALTGGDNPWAVVGSAYLQYNSFHLMGLYRNYQLGFDNPYQRSFSNYRRYKRSIYEDYFYLESPFYSQLYLNNPQPQAERGWYLNTRYQFARQFVASIEYDNWLRNADDIAQYRLRGSLQYRPIFPVTVQLYQKYQGRDVQNNRSLEYFETKEFRGTLRLRLSRFSELSLQYLNAVTQFRSRPRFGFPGDPNTSGQPYDDSNYAGIIASPSYALGGQMTWNVNEWLKLRGYMGYYEGFMWSFEDTQFFVMNSPSGSMRYWFSVYSRVSANLSMRLKYTRDKAVGQTNHQARDNENQIIGPGSSSYRPGRYYRTDLVQPLQEFFYVELNYHF